jgi:hypothetical protein
VAAIRASPAFTQISTSAGKSGPGGDTQGPSAGGSGRHRPVLDVADEQADVRVDDLVDRHRQDLAVTDVAGHLGEEVPGEPFGDQLDERQSPNRLRGAQGPWDRERRGMTVIRQVADMGGSKRLAIGEEVTEILAHMGGLGRRAQLRVCGGRPRTTSGHHQETASGVAATRKPGRTVSFRALRIVRGFASGSRYATTAANSRSSSPSSIR